MNDNPPEFESSLVRISVPENVELGTPLYAANAQDKDSGKSGEVTYSLMMIPSNMQHQQQNATNLSSSSTQMMSYHQLQYGNSLPETSGVATPYIRQKLTAANAYATTMGNYLLPAAAAAAAAAASADLEQGLFAIDARSGHLTLSRHLDYETSQRHSLIVTATDSGEPPLSANLTILVEVQDVNDNPPVFERNEYSIKVLESMPINSQVSEGIQ